ncbi:uncharacterized protein LOC144933370 [Lampetra fluviatilis]
MGENGEISAEFTQEMARLRKLVSHLETQNAELRRRGSGAAAATHSAGEAHAGAAGRHSAKSDKKRSDTDTAAPHRAGEVQTVGNQARCNGGVMPSGSPTAQSGAQNEDGVVAAAATADTLDDVVMLDLQRTDVVEEDTWLYTSPSRKPTRDGDALEWSRRVLDNPSPKMREATLALARRLEKATRRRSWHGDDFNIPKLPPDIGNNMLGRRGYGSTFTLASPELVAVTDTFSNTTVSGEMVAPGTSKRMGRLGSLTDVESVARQQEEALRLECSTSSVFATRGSSPSRHGLVSPSSQEFPSGVPVSPHRSASTPREPTSRGDPSREPARTPGLDVSSDWSRSTRAQREHVSYDTTPRELARDPAPRERAPRDRAPQDLIRRDRSMSPSLRHLRPPSLQTTVRTPSPGRPIKATPLLSPPANGRSNEREGRSSVPKSRPSLMPGATSGYPGSLGAPLYPPGAAMLGAVDASHLKVRRSNSPSAGNIPSDASRSLRDRQARSPARNFATVVPRGRSVGRVNNVIAVAPAATGMGGAGARRSASPANNLTNGGSLGQTRLLSVSSQHNPVRDGQMLNRTYMRSDDRQGGRGASPHGTHQAVPVNTPPRHARSSHTTPTRAPQTCATQSRPTQPGAVQTHNRGATGTRRSSSLPRYVGTELRVHKQSSQNPTAV